MGQASSVRRRFHSLFNVMSLFFCARRDRQRRSSRALERECFIIQSFAHGPRRLHTCLSRYLKAPDNYLCLSVSCPSLAEWENPPPVLLQSILSESPVIVNSLDLDSFMDHMVIQSTSKEMGIPRLPLSNFILGFCHLRMTHKEPAAIDFVQTFGPTMQKLHVESYPTYQSQAEYNFYCQLTSLKSFTIGVLETSVPCTRTKPSPVRLETVAEAMDELSDSEDFEMMPTERKVPLLQKGLRELPIFRIPPLVFQTVAHLCIKETLWTHQTEAFFVSLVKCLESNPNLESFSPPMGLETSNACWNSLSLLCNSRQNHGEVFGTLELKMENFFQFEYLQASQEEIKKFIIAAGSARTFVQITGVTWPFLEFALVTFGPSIVQPFTSALSTVLGWGNSRTLNNFPFAALEKVKLTMDTMDIDMTPWNVNPSWKTLDYLSINITEVEMVGFIDKCILDGNAPVRSTVSSLHIRSEHDAGIHEEMFPEGPLKLVDIFPSLTTLTLHILLEDQEWSRLFTAIQAKIPQLTTLSVQPYHENSEEMFLTNLGKESPLVKMQCLTNFQLVPYLPGISDGEPVNITDKFFFKVLAYLRIEQLSFRGHEGALRLVTADGLMALTRVPKNEITGIAQTLKVFDNNNSSDFCDTEESSSRESYDEEELPMGNVYSLELGMEAALDAVRIMAMINRRAPPPVQFPSAFDAQF